MASSTARCSVAVAAFALAYFAFASPVPVSAIRFDGVYYALVGRGLFLHFRFYPAGSVVCVPSTGTPTQVAGWFRRHMELSGDGTYSVSGDRLQFRVTVRRRDIRRGDIDYWGTIGRDSLELTSYSHISGLQNTLLYKFVPVHFAK